MNDTYKIDKDKTDKDKTDKDKIDKDMGRCNLEKNYNEEYLIKKYCIEDKEYPEKLRQIARPPGKLYVKGKLPRENQPVVAIVGARNATPYGRKMAYDFANVLSANGVQVISGFARGIDRAGHEGALAAGCETFAVLGNGVDICYPRENVDLYQRVVESGGFISEFFPGTSPQPKFFPMRNRIISGLADVVLVVEARKKSGALITADFALEQGKDVYAVPGRIGDDISYGCNRLIAQGAGIALSPEEILKDLDIAGVKTQYFHKKSKKLLVKEEEIVYSCIRLQPMHIDDIMLKTKMELSKLVSILFHLEMRNLIQEITKNYYVRL